MIPDKKAALGHGFSQDCDGFGVQELICVFDEQGSNMSQRSVSGNFGPWNDNYALWNSSIFTTLWAG